MNLDIALPARPQPLVIAWPIVGSPMGFVEFTEAEQWREFIRQLGIHPLIPQIVSAKFARAQTLYLLGWMDLGLVKAGELAALIALELALQDRYGAEFPKRKPGFATLLKHLVVAHGLTDAQIPMIAKSSGTAVGQLTGDTHPTLAERRNSLAHGDPFEGLPVAGLLELTRDLINFAYRQYVAERMAS